MKSGKDVVLTRFYVSIFKVRLCRVIISSWMCISAVQMGLSHI